MKPAAKRLWSILISLFFFMGAILLFSSLVAPQYGEVLQLKGERNSLKVTLKEEEQLLKTASRLLGEYQSATTLRDTLFLILPPDENISGILNQVQGIARATGVIIEGINAELLPLQPQLGESVVEPVGTFRMTLRLRGNYESLKAYAQSLETNVRIIDIESFTLSEGSNKGPLRANVTILTYYQR